MPALSLNHINLRAEHAMLERLRDFYVDVVGLQVGWRPPFDFPGYWLYLGDSAVVHLVGVPTQGGPPRPRSGTFDHVAFTSAGLRDFEARLSSLGVEYRRVLVPGTRQIQLFLTDPSGNGVELNFADGDE